MSRFCEHETFKDVCGICHRDSVIEKQATRIERLEKALRPFADESIFSGPQHEYVTVKRSDCDIALAALKEERT